MKYYILLLFFMGREVLFAQGVSGIPNIMTPETATLGKFGSYPASYYTGSADISIPLFTLKDADIAISGILQYDGSGFIPNEEAGLVGLNWSLFSGGLITRTVNWRADDRNQFPLTTLNTERGYIYGMLNAGLGIYTNKEYLRKLDFLHLGSQGLPTTDLAYEYAPDVFNFNFNGHQGSFFLGNDGIVKVVSEKNYKVSLVNFSGQNDLCYYQTSEISITTDEGDIYTFGGDLNSVEISFPYNTNSSNGVIVCPAGTINAWHLKKIQTSKGRIITYNYESQSTTALSLIGPNLGLSPTIDYAYEKIFLNEEFGTSFTGSSQETYNTRNQRYRSLSKIVYLSSITSSIGSVHFTYSIKPHPIYGSSEIVLNQNKTKQLDRILIKDFTGKSITNIGFEYLYYGSSADGYRQFLDKINFKDLSNYATSHFYKFDYYKTNQLPNPLTKGLDIWGYYNGKNSNLSLMPDYGSGSPDFTVDLTKRNADPTFSDIGMLKTITYPTGGWTEFRYEGHDYNKVLRKTVAGGMTPSWVTENGAAGGLRIKEIVNSEGMSQKFYYKKNYVPAASGLLSSGLLTDFAVYYLDNIYYFNSMWPAARDLILQDNNILASSSFSESPIGYSEITEVNSDGYTKYYYSNHETNPDLYTLGTDAFKIFPATDISTTNYFQQVKRLATHSSCKLERGKLLNVKVFDNNNTLIKEMINQYNTDPLRFNESTLGFSWPVSRPGGSLFNSFAMYSFQNNIKQQTTKEYVNGQTITNTVNYFYASNANPKLIRKEELNSVNQNIITYYKYCDDYPGVLPYTTMLSRHMKGVVIEQSIHKNGVHQKTVKTNYQDWGNNILAPLTVQEQILAGSLVTKLQFNKYDSYCNLLEYQKPGDVKNVYIYGYNSSYPVASIINTDFLTANSFVNQTIINSPQSDQAIRTHLNTLRTSLPNSHVTSYSYKPISGISSVTNPNGFTSFYEYDGFNRLSVIKDHEGKVLRKICYNFSGQAENCTSSVYSSDVQNGNFTKACIPGYIGSTHLYSIPQGAYLSTISLLDANQLAAAALATEGQANANAIGTCTPISCSFSPASNWQITNGNISSNGTTVNFNLTVTTSFNYPSYVNPVQVAVISGPCKPSVGQTFLFSLSGRNWRAIIEPTGFVFIQLVSGSHPGTGISIAIPNNSYEL